MHNSFWCQKELKQAIFFNVIEIILVTTEKSGKLKISWNKILKNNN